MMMKIEKKQEENITPFHKKLLLNKSKKIFLIRQLVVVES